MICSTGAGRLPDTLRRMVEIEDVKGFMNIIPLDMHAQMCASIPPTLTSRKGSSCFCDGKSLVIGAYDFTHMSCDHMSQNHMGIFFLLDVLTRSQYIDIYDLFNPSTFSTK